MFLHWFLSATVRRAAELRRHVGMLVNEQRDVLDRESIEAITAATEDLKRAIDTRQDKAALEKQMTELVAVAERCLKPYPNPGVRENIKELFVAATVIFSITTFFLQLTKIPTGSMQPTLFGITRFNLKETPTEQIPSQLGRLVSYWVHGISYYHVVAQADGELDVKPAQRVFPFVKRQKLMVGGVSHVVWFPPDELAAWAGIHKGQVFRKGDDVVKLKVVTGDHLLVDRMSYNFRRPERGEIFVFKTRGITGIREQDQLYIKRLVGLGGERVLIGDDQHLVIDGKRLDAATPHFENVYTFSSIPRESHYFGHLNQEVARRHGYGYLAPLFPDREHGIIVAPKSYLAMGDNTLNSADSRTWGSLPQENVIGKCWFVYWPFTERFGWGNR
jgi:signal peptidase I